MAEIDVLIVGAGPTGLALGIELQRLGLSSRLIEKNPEPARHSQAIVVQARTLEQFERYGIAETAIERGRKLLRASLVSEHRTIVTFPFERIPGRYPFVLFLPQNETERLLIEHLESIGGRVERGTELRSFTDTGDAVEAELAGPEGSETVRARWLVGCDGAHSTVRNLTRVPFVGETVGLSFFLGDLELAGPDVPGDELRIYLHRGDVVFIGRLGRYTHRVIVALHEEQGRDQERVPTVEDFRSAIARNAGAGITVIRSMWMTPFHINQRKATHYRIGRVFLAGDASHIHSPVAGQGMNTGIQDVANLAWKLAAVRAGAPDSLLDSYESERGAVGEALLAITSRGLAAVTATNPLVDLMRDAIASMATRFDPVIARLVGFISETAITYRHSPIVCDTGGEGRLRAGDRAPDADIDDRRLLAPLREARPLALVIDGDPGAVFELIPAATAVAVRGDRLDRTTRDAYGRGMVHVVRPDGYIGFRGRIGNREALSAYARGVAATPASR